MATSIEDPLSVEGPVLESLCLPCQSAPKDRKEESVGKETTPCLMCEDSYSVYPDKDEFLKHLLMGHNLVISDVNLISNFKSYILYWKQRFKEQPITDFCSKIETVKGDNLEETSEYFLLSDVHPEDKQLREFQQKRKLEWVLAAQQKEREDDRFSHTCLFCKQHFTENRADLFNHMAEDHAFNIGQPDNLVFVDELLDKLEDQLKNLICLFCEKLFKDRVTLKEHMRKKQHRKINPKNKSYDKYYVINYLELGKNWETIQHELDYPDVEPEDTDTEDEWCGWEEEAGSQAVCLYCDYSSSISDKLHLHMQELHDLDLQEVKLRLNLNFYQQVKLVNYIRRQVHLGICVGCQQKFDDKKLLQDHMHQSGHTNVQPDISVWDQPQYFFPTYENDNLLCQLEDVDDETEDIGCHSNIEAVIAEDSCVPESILSNEHVRQQILTP